MRGGGGLVPNYVTPFTTLGIYRISALQPEERVSIQQTFVLLYKHMIVMTTCGCLLASANSPQSIDLSAATYTCIYTALVLSWLVSQCSSHSII